jgi:hypothetical protein
MRAIKQAKKLIEQNANSAVGLTFSKLILSLESDIEFSVKDLYALDTAEFELAIEVLKDWRIDRFYIGKAKAFDMATHAQTISVKK